MQKGKRQRSVKQRRSKFFDGALGVTLIWLSIAFFFFISGGFGGKSDPRPFIVFSLVMPVSWLIAFLLIRAQNAAGKTLDQLKALSPEAFEEWVGTRFQDMGYSMKISGMGGDHGIDLVVEKQHEVAVVQCKKFKTWSVGEPVLRDLYGAMHDFGATRAYLVTTGHLTKSAIAWIADKPIEVWDGDYLARLSKQLASPLWQANKESLTLNTPATAQSVAGYGVSKTDGTEVLTASKPTCPKCGSELVQRSNRSTGQPFLACPRFPHCRHTEPLRS